jgi:hypothetical protein
MLKSMAVDEPSTIDIMSVDPTGALVLTISDHLDWSDSLAHERVLQEKLNSYLAFIESGQILEHHPEVSIREIVH